MESKQICVLGTDPRQTALAQLLAEDGHRLVNAEEAEWVILPIGGSLPDGLRPDQRIVAGKISPQMRAEAEKQNLTILDYFDREELAMRNAIPTAEGAIRVAMEALPITIHGSKAVVFGFGRVGQAVGVRLNALGAKVVVWVRREEQRAHAEMLGLECAHRLYDANLVINTVPARVLHQAELAQLRPGAVVIDLASLPGGVDDGAAAELGVHVIHALALPGKESPKTAAQYLRRTVYSMLEG